MVTLDVAATWTRILSVTAGACTAAGAPGPATRIAGKAAVTWLEGPWLGIFDFAGLRRSEREILESFIREHAEPLLLVRHLLLAKPLGGDIFVELTPQAQEAMPEGWRDAPRPILFLAPAGRVTRERRRQYLDALVRLRIPLVSGGSELWGLREFDADLLVAMAQLRSAAGRAAFRAAIDPSQLHLFEQQLPAAEAAVLDDLVGGRDEEGAFSLDVESVSSLHPGAHPLAGLRLALQPATHPWKRGWRLTRRAPLFALVAALALLLLLAASGCASTPALSIAQPAVVPRPPPGARCESLLVSQELDLPAEGDIGEVRLTLRDIPEITGKLRVLVRQPRFASSLDLDAQGAAAFDKVM